MYKDTVLIFDQDPHIIWTLKVLLEVEKYIVIALSDIDRLKKNFKEFEISALITEYKVNGDCVVDHIRELKKDFPELYVMVITDQDIEEKDYKEILRSGVEDIFTKPFSTEKILLQLKKGLAKRRQSIQRNKVSSNYPLLIELGNRRE
jgi:DNA-binding NtrC family response regulator